MTSWLHHVALARNKSLLHTVKLNTLSLKIDLIFFIKNLWECENFSHKKTDKNFYQELEKKNIGQLFFKVANNWFDRTNAL